MIRIADKSDLRHLASMLKAMYVELMPEEATTDINVYKKAMCEILENDLEVVYISKHGFFVVRDESEPMTPNKKRYQGTRVYIEPEHRKGFLLASFYKRLFSDFPDGEIVGLTESNSEHINVLDKRHIEVARIYILRRS